MPKGRRTPPRGAGKPARPGGGGRPARPGRPGPDAGRTARPAAKPAPAADSTFVSAGPFRLGLFPGAMPGKWIDRWQDRHATPLELVPLPAAELRAALDDGLVDAALVRLPIDRDGLHVIALYDEMPVVVVPADSHLTAADELQLADLADEIVIVPADDVLRMPPPDAAGVPRFDPPATTGEAIETVAAGVGIVVVPMSLARLHHRSDVAHRPLVGGPVSTVALAWIADRTTADVEAFVGIVRGRTANSSR